MRKAIPAYYKVFEYDFSQNAFEYYFEKIMILAEKQLR